MKLQKAVVLIYCVAFSAIAQEHAKPDANPPGSSDVTNVAKNKAESEAFLSKNAKAPGITVLPSGLQYRVIEAGTGEIPTTNNLVFIKYRGRFIDGTEFDHHNRFLTWTTGGIKGWQEALQKMKVGAKWQIFVPSALAFGDAGEEYHHVSPNSTLIYDLELLSIAPPNPELSSGGLGHALDENTASNPSATDNPDEPKREK